MGVFFDSKEVVLWKNRVIDALIQDAALERDFAKQVADDIELEIKNLGESAANPQKLSQTIETKLMELGYNFMIPKIVFKKSLVLEKLELTENALVVLKKRYLKKDESGNVVETPEEMFWRVARTIAEADKYYDSNADLDEVAAKFYNMMVKLEFLPNSPTLMNAGRELGQLSACFVLPVGDSMESIFEAIKYTALIHKSGGGTGFSFSRIRPKNDVVRSTKGVSSGPVSFMQVFDAATETIKQGGTRRGANMGILRVDHPDIMEFITAKQDKKKLNNFNISIGITEKFMEAVKNNKHYDLLNPRTKRIIQGLNAKTVFDKIVEMSWMNGEPGIVFLDRLNRDNPTPLLGEIESTNPCGEQPLLPFESCNLGSINLSKFVKNKEIDFESLRETVRTAIHFLDNVIDVNKYPLPQIEEMTKKNRKIGLGVMGFADMLILLGVTYNSEDSLAIAEQVMSFLHKEGRIMSQEIGGIRGEFPSFKGSIHDTNCKKMRNATVTTIAPTGTISMIAGCSSGIEPLFAVSFIKNVLDNTELIETNIHFLKIARREKFYSEELIKKIARTGSIHGIADIPEKWLKVFVTAHDITPEWHIRMQAAFQKYTDNAVSKTVNFPKDATAEDIAKVYLLAYSLECKGVTVYRDGSREEQVLNIHKVNKESGAEKSSSSSKINLTPRPRPEAIQGATRRMTTGCGNLYITINRDKTGPFEVFTSMGKAGGCATSQAEAIGRLISLSLRAGVDPDHIIKQLAGVRCPAPAWENGEMVLSCADAISKALHKFLKEHEGGNGNNPSQKKAENSNYLNALPVSTDGYRPCPTCGSPLVFEEGCFNCKACGYSKCS